MPDLNKESSAGPPPPHNCPPQVCQYSEHAARAEEKRRSRGRIGRTLGIAALVLTASAATGYVAESHTNEVALGKAKTAEICHDADPKATVISKAIDECMEQGVPGGNKVGKDKFHVDEPISFLNAYVETQKHEAAHVEINRVAAWTMGTPVVTALYFGSVL